MKIIMKKTLAVAVLLTALFAAQNANGSDVIKQTNENAFVSVQPENGESLITDERLILTETPVEIISVNEEISSNSEQCNYGVGRYSGNVSIHYYNNCNRDIKIGYQYKFKKCCANCNCSWSGTQNGTATLKANTPRSRYKVLKQGANETMTYVLIDYWER
jgi:hypothetical protein